jgi:hypothetical protein
MRPQTSETHARRSSRAWIVATIVVVVVGSAVRIAGARGDLWFDEAWSWWNAQQASSWWGTFTWPHDNNHQLNSLWMCLLGPDASKIAYSALAVVSGSEGRVGLALNKEADCRRVRRVSRRADPPRP